MDATGGGRREVNPTIMAQQVATTATIVVGLVLGGCGPTEPEPRGPDGSDPPVFQFEDLQAGSGLEFPLAYDRSREIGIKETIGHPAAVLDADGDGRLDILLGGPNRVELFRNLGHWKFRRMTETGLRQPGYWQGVAVGDVNNDGQPDIFLSGFGCVALYLNRGDCRFRDVTAESGLGDIQPDSWETSAALADVDLDGRLDLYVGRYLDLAGRAGACTYPGGIVTACAPTDFAAQRGFLYRNLGGARFTDVTAQFGLADADGKTLGVAFGDANNDGYPDLYLANDQVPCDLYINQSGRRFLKAGAASGTALGVNGSVQAGMGVAFGDFDEDAREDLAVSNYRGEPVSIYHNDGTNHFSNAAYTSGIGPATTPFVGWGVQWVDLDNDGRLDLVIANGHPLHRIHELDDATDTRQPFQFFRNLGNGRLAEASVVGNGHPRPIAGRALCTGDFDDDGRMDLLISDIEGDPLLLRNVTLTPNHWLRVRLNATAVIEGAAIHLHTGDRTLLRYCSTSGSYLSASDPRVHFGCGPIDGPLTVEVRWPGGATELRENIRPDTDLVLTR